MGLSERTCAPRGELVPARAPVSNHCRSCQLVVQTAVIARRKANGTSPIRQLRRQVFLNSAEVIQALAGQITAGNPCWFRARIDNSSALVSASSRPPSRQRQTSAQYAVPLSIDAKTERPVSDAPVLDQVSRKPRYDGRLYRALQGARAVSRVKTLVRSRTRLPSWCMRASAKPFILNTA